MAARFSSGLKAQILNAFRGAVTAANSLEHGAIDIYSGAQPANADSPASGTLLLIATVGSGPFTPGSALNGLDFAAPVDGVLSKDPAEVWSGVGVADGTAGWFRFRGNAVDGGGASNTLPRLDGRIGLPGSGAEMILSNLNVTTGATTTIDSLSIAWPVGS